MSKVKYDFSDERYIVVGASSGIGRQVAKFLAESNAVVLAIARREDKLKSLQNEYPNNITYTALDVCDYKQFEQAIDTFVERYGKLNGGVYAAGVYDVTVVSNFSVDLVRDMNEINYIAATKFLQIITKRKYSLDGTSTVFISSIYAVAHEKATFAYASSKAALSSFVCSAAKEISRRKHRVNSIMPGLIGTAETSEITQKVLGIDAVNKTNSMSEKYLLGSGSPLDVANMALYLLSDAARWITGTNVIVDGGYLA